ncbi:MAG: hypothetical protein ABIG40_03160 [Parcubacteria group bacterium]
MIKATNSAKGLEITKPNKDVIILIGHFNNKSPLTLTIFAKDAPHLFDSTNPTEIYASPIGGKRRLVGIIDWKPQGTAITFFPHYQIFVDSDEFKQEVERVLAS